MKLFAGIDGGGTATTLAIHDSDGLELFRDKFEAFNLNSIGESRFISLLKKIFETLNKFPECAYVCIGAAGISNNETRRLINSVSTEMGYADRLYICGDQDIALYGATGGTEGIILISGTGSICYGMNSNLDKFRSGGWGHLIDDAGSGYCLGKDALNAVVRAWDGRSENTMLTNLIFEKLSITDISELISKVYSNTEKSYIASFSTLVEEAAKKGDCIASKIIEQNALELANMVLSVYKKINSDNTILCLMGGLLTNDTLLRELLVQNVKVLMPSLSIKGPKLDAVTGAVVLAKKMYYDLK